MPMDASQKTSRYLGNYFGVGIPIPYYISPQVVKEKRHIPRLQSFQDIAYALDIAPTKLAWLAYHKELSVVEHYTHFLIQKRRGGYRKISKPKRLLADVQRWILEKVLQLVPVHEKATAYKFNYSIYNNAKFHGSKKLVIRIDLKDFFSSIGIRSELWNNAL